MDVFLSMSTVTEETERLVSSCVCASNAVCYSYCVQLVSVRF